GIGTGARFNVIMNKEACMKLLLEERAAWQGTEWQRVTLPPAVLGKSGGGRREEVHLTWAPPGGPF
ncbi:MAG: hypothetical protein AAFQ34_16015, partial [Pseudomonadota bacterium]